MTARYINLHFTYFYLLTASEACLQASQYWHGTETEMVGERDGQGEHIMLQLQCALPAVGP